MDRPYQRGGPHQRHQLYSKLINGLKVAGVDINRKMLSEIAINDPEGFAKLAETAKAALK